MGVKAGGGSPRSWPCPRTPIGSCRPRGASADLRPDHPPPTRYRSGWRYGTCEERGGGGAELGLSRARELAREKRRRAGGGFSCREEDEKQLGV